MNDPLLVLLLLLFIKESFCVASICFNKINRLNGQRSIIFNCMPAQVQKKVCLKKANSPHTHIWGCSTEMPTCSLHICVVTCSNDANPTSVTHKPHTESRLTSDINAYRSKTRLQTKTAPYLVCIAVHYRLHSRSHTHTHTSYRFSGARTISASCHETAMCRASLPVTAVCASP